VLQIPTTGRMAAEKVGEALSLYMMMFVTGEDLLGTNQSEVLAVRDQIHEIYPAWDETQLWLRDAAGAPAGTLSLVARFPSRRRGASWTKSTTATASGRTPSAWT